MVLISLRRQDVLSVTAAVAYMLSAKGTNLKKLDVSWNGAKKMMGSVDAFLVSLQQFDKDNVNTAIPTHNLQTIPTRSL